MKAVASEAERRAPEQGDDVADAEVALHERAHGHARVGGLLPPVVADGGDDVGGHAHLRRAQGLGRGYGIRC